MSEDIFPLQEVPYENTTFLVLRKMGALLKLEYRDYMQFPDEVGCQAKENKLRLI